MPPFGPIKRTNLVRYLRAAGFDGPDAGGRHQIMRNRGGRVLILPNPHKGDIGVSLLAHILRQAGISKEQWEQL